MRLQCAPSRPFMPQEQRLVVRGAIHLKVRPGEAPERIASHQDVMCGAALASARFDGGPVDRVLRRHSPGIMVSRQYASRRHAGRAGSGHQGWDDLEHALGLSDTFRVFIDPEVSLLRVLAGLRELDIVEEAGPHYLCQAPFALAADGRIAEADYTAFDRVGAAEARRREPGDSALIVGVVDSGCALRHPELIGRLRPGADTVDLDDERVSRGLRLIGDTSGRDRDPQDEMGHGTGCASIIAAKGDRVPPGLAGAVRILPIRALARAQKVDQPEPTAVGSIADIDAAIKLAVDLGATVLNLSFGTPASALKQGDPVPHEAAIRYADQRGCIMVAASGNRGDDVPYYPAALPEVIAVGSVDANNRPSSFSSRGPHVDLCAPGERIPGAAIDGYQHNTGTSFAAPFVAAAAAMLVSAARRASTPLSGQDVRRILVRSATPFAAEATALGCGAGVLHLPAALNVLEDATRGPPLPAANPAHRGRATA